MRPQIDSQGFYNPPVYSQTDERGSVYCACCTKPHWLGALTAEHADFYCRAGKTHHLVELPTKAMLAKEALATLGSAIAKATALMNIIETLP